MFSPEFIQSDMFQWVVLPSLIFLARMSDVTLATLRNIFLSKSVKYIVPFLGFIEVLIWLLAISQIMKNLHNPVCFVAYALGYSMGIFVGIKIEERLALGLQVMRIITQKDSEELIAALVNHSFGITTLDGHGSKGPVKIILTVVKRKDIVEVRDIIEKYHPSAFFSIEDIRTVNRGVFKQSEQGRLDHLKRVFPFGGGK
ncbi:MAG: DUF2179 domain-containing protein [Bacteroidia bacterium]|nr:DUF2179 domain-containing protein [Bacteroidia bacterium]